MHSNTVTYTLSCFELQYCTSGIPPWKRRIMEEIERRREEASRAEVEARERELAEARRVLALPPWLRELVLQKRVLCVSLTPELERVLREERERAEAEERGEAPPPPPPTTSTQPEEEAGAGAGSGEGVGDRANGRPNGCKEAKPVAGRGLCDPAMQSHDPEGKDASDEEGAAHEGSRIWVHRFEGSGAKRGLGLNPFTGSMGGLNPFREMATSRPTPECSRLLSLSSGLPAERSAHGDLWNGSFDGPARGSAVQNGPMHFSTLSVNVGSGTKGGGPRTRDESSSANGPLSSGNPFSGSVSHQNAPGGVAADELPSGGGEHAMMLQMSPGGGWTSLTSVNSTLKRTGTNAGTLARQTRSVTRDGRIQIKCAPPFVLTRRIP